MSNLENDNEKATTSKNSEPITIKKEQTEDQDVIQIKNKEVIEKEKCPICLHKFSFKSKSYASTCFHSFCFECLLEWTKVRYNCPLCKQAFERIIYDVKSTMEYKEYILKPKESESMTQPLEIIAYLAPGEAQTEHSLTTTSQPVSKASWVVNKEPAPIEFRMLVYKKGWYVNPNQVQVDIKITNIELEFNDEEDESKQSKPLVEDVGVTIPCTKYKPASRHRNTTPRWYKNNQTSLFRLNFFLYRELKGK